MARTVDPGDNKLYRVVVVRENHLGAKYRACYGPYEYKRTAGFVLSYMTNGWHSGGVLDKYIEETQTQWYRNSDD